jgi:hypothetical protein
MSPRFRLTLWQTVVIPPLVLGAVFAVYRRSANEWIQNRYMAAVNVGLIDTLEGNGFEVVHDDIRIQKVSVHLSRGGTFPRNPVVYDSLVRIANIYHLDVSSTDFDNNDLKELVGAKIYCLTASKTLLTDSTFVYQGFSYLEFLDVRDTDIGHDFLLSMSASGAPLSSISAFRTRLKTPLVFPVDKRRPTVLY